MLRYILLATTILSLCTADIYAQTRRRNTSRVWEGVTINPKIGPSLYMGDMVDKSNWRLTTGASVEKELLPWLSGRFEMTGGLLAGVMNAGSDIGFDTKYVDITLGATMFPVDLIGGYYNKRLVNPSTATTLASTADAASASSTSRRILTARQHGRRPATETCLPRWCAAS